MIGERLAKWPSGQGVKAFPADAISSLISLFSPAYKDKVFAWSLGQSRSYRRYCRRKWIRALIGKGMGNVSVE